MIISQNKKLAVNPSQVQVYRREIYDDPIGQYRYRIVAELLDQSIVLGKYKTINATLEAWRCLCECLNKELFFEMPED